MAMYTFLLSMLGFSGVLMALGLVFHVFPTKHVNGFGALILAMVISGMTFVFLFIGMLAGSDDVWNESMTGIYTAAACMVMSISSSVSVFSRKFPRDI